MKKILFIIWGFWLLVASSLSAQDWSEKYTAQKPLVVVGDWDKPPYEFQNDQSQPAGSNIDLLKAIFKKLDIQNYVFVLKEWSSALKAFERGDADLILANGRRYNRQGFYTSKNIINYNRICAATSQNDSLPNIITFNELLNDIPEGIVLKQSDYTNFFFRNLPLDQASKLVFQTPKVALQGISDGDYKYFLWGEEPLKWKIKQLNLEGITLCDVQIPASEIHIIGFDQDLIEDIDDIYSRLKQSGEVQRINDQWMHPERVKNEVNYKWILYVVAILVAIVVFYGIGRLAKSHVRKATQDSRNLNNIMLKALHMGKFHVMVYDIRKDLWMNNYGTPILPIEGITMKEFAEHIHPMEAEEFTHRMQRLLSGRDRKFELRKRWRSYDTQQWLNLDGHAIVEFNEKGRPAYIINVVNDVTQDVKDYQTTHELMCKYKKLVNIPFMAMSLYDKKGWIIGLNDAMKETCGYNEEDPESVRYWTSMNMFDIPLFREAYSPSSREQLFGCQHLLYENFGVDSYIEFHLHPLLDNEGEIVGYLTSSLDITDKRNRNHELHAQNRETRRINTSIARYERWLNFLTTGCNTFLWYSNIEEQKAFFYRSLESKGKDFITLPFNVLIDYMESTDRAKTLELYNNQLPNQKQFDSILHFNNTVLNNGEAWYHITGAPIFDCEGHVVGHRGRSLDITQDMIMRLKLEKGEKLAKESMRLKSGFMASMTHELRTPLNAIIGFTDILSSIDSEEERSEYIRIIRTNCDMLQRLINDILVASSLNENATSIEKEDCDFSKEFNDICTMLKPRVDNGLEFITENPYNSFYTCIDKGRIAQVLVNFVTNAVKFTKEGYIKVGYRYERGGLRIYCSDTGEGIPKDKQDVIFDRFVKLNEFVQGTGMGLSICKSIAERCGGKVGVDSEGTGTGSTFWMWIPCERKLIRQSTNDQYDKHTPFNK